MDSVATIVLWAVPVVFAITLHEAAHGYVAKLFGDQTAWMLGRVTANPIKHIDPVGTILVPGALLLFAKLGGPGFIFGWAKPVPVNFGNLRNPKRDMFWVAGAGPAANFAMAIAWGSCSRPRRAGAPCQRADGNGGRWNTDQPDADGVEPIADTSARRGRIASACCRILCHDLREDGAVRLHPRHRAARDGLSHRPHAADPARR
jgi:hypothetical protein